MTSRPSVGSAWPAPGTDRRFGVQPTPTDTPPRHARSRSRSSGSDCDPSPGGSSGGRDSRRGSSGRSSPDVVCGITARTVSRSESRGSSSSGSSGGEPSGDWDSYVGACVHGAVRAGLARCATQPRRGTPQASSATSTPSTQPAASPVAGDAARPAGTGAPLAVQVGVYREEHPVIRGAPEAQSARSNVTKWIDHLAEHLRRRNLWNLDAIILDGVVENEGVVDFLRNLEDCSTSLNIDALSRGYRDAFSVNYRALFPGHGRLYRSDVLQACFQQYTSLWVNGDQYHFSQGSKDRSSEMMHAMSELWGLLSRWLEIREAHSDFRRAMFWSFSNEEGSWSFADEERAGVACTKSGVTWHQWFQDLLFVLDSAWANFECTYINDLITIETKAREPVIKAAECASKLVGPGSGAEKEDLERQLVGLLAELNSVANDRRKGRKDLGYDILASARSVISKDLVCPSACAAVRWRAARILASDVVNAYISLKDCLRKMGLAIWTVDPQLRNNSRFVDLLVDWEEAWEIGQRYMCQAPMLDAVCHLVAEVRAAQRLVPALTAMCEDRDAEFFLVLPRLVLLSFLAAPGDASLELVRTLLPHRFPLSRDNRPTYKDVLQGGLPEVFVASFDSELYALIQSYREATRALGGCAAVAGSPADGQEAGPRLLGSRPVSGGGVEAEEEKKGKTAGADQQAVHVPTFASKADQQADHRLPICFNGVPALHHMMQPTAWQLLVTWAVQGTTELPEDLDLSPTSRKPVAVFMRQLERWSMELQRHCPVEWNDLSAVCLRLVVRCRPEKAA